MDINCYAMGNGRDSSLKLTLSTVISVILFKSLSLIWRESFLITNSARNFQKTSLLVSFLSHHFGAGSIATDMLLLVSEVALFSDISITYVHISLPKETQVSVILKKKGHFQFNLL